MTAKEAREKSRQSSEQKDRNEYAEIMEMINVRTSLGDTQLLYTGKMCEDARKKLIKDGYYVSTNRMRFNGWVINW